MGHEPGAQQWKCADHTAGLVAPGDGLQGGPTLRRIHPIGGAFFKEQMMSKRLRREPIDDLADELVQAVRAWTRQPKPVATATLHRAIDTYRRCWLGEEEQPSDEANEVETTAGLGSKSRLKAA